MLRLIFRRLAAAAPGIAGVIVVTFLLNRALPGDPAAFFAGPAATRASPISAPFSRYPLPGMAGVGLWDVPQEEKTQFAVAKLAGVVRIRRSHEISAPA